MLSWIIEIILNWLWDKLAKAGLARARQAAADKDAEKKSEDIAERLKEAQTDKEKADAAKNINDSVFS
jgi:hypothetical protein